MNQLSIFAGYMHGQGVFGLKSAGEAREEHSLLDRQSYKKQI
jgi:hypothetical protein